MLARWRPGQGESEDTRRPHAGWVESRICSRCSGFSSERLECRRSIAVVTNIDRLGLVLLIAGGLGLVAGLADRWWWLPDPARRALRFPLGFVTESYHALLLLTGVAILGGAALIPATLVLHLLGLTS